VRIVLLRALYLGDFLTGVPAYRAVRRAYPSAEIVLAAPRALEPLVGLLEGAVDTLADTAELAPLPPAARDADLAIDLHGKGPASRALLHESGARRVVGFFTPAFPHDDGVRFDPDEHETERWCRLLRGVGIPADPADLDLPVPPDAPPPGMRGATVVHPGAASESRRWPVARWIDVVRAERARGRRVVVTGSADEIERARTIARGAGLADADVVAGRTDLGGLAAIVAAAARVVCGDTGVAHLATAYHRPSVVLFGPTPPGRWGPPARPYHRVLWYGTTGDPHAERIDPGLAAISAERVIEELARLPERTLAS
jgi:ADP-heptose:LPS heptosyltransferase